MHMGEMEKMDAKKSPLKDKPLRQAGQSVQEELDNILDEKIFSHAIVLLFLIILTALEWHRWTLNILPNPFILTLITIPLGLFFVFRIVSLRHTVRNLKLGRDGEKVVGEFLERLRADGAAVFHDIVGDGFNIDHVVLSSKGIFAIETKTWSKPRDGRIRFDGVNLTIDGLGNKNEILKQVYAESNWLHKMLLESTGKYFNVRPVVLFPGWYVEPNDEVPWVLEPKQLPGRLRKMPNVLSDSDKSMAAYHLSRYIRSL